jgi:hypothetical protein
LNRDIAVKLLKEIQNKIPQLTPQEVSFIQAGHSYSLHFKGLCNECRRQVLEIANEHSLFIEENGTELTLLDTKT